MAVVTCSSQEKAVMTSNFSEDDWNLIQGVV